MNKIDLDYQALLQDILDNGVQKGDRTGTGTISVFGRQIRHKMSDGFPLLTTKKMYFKGIITELLWFLKGDTNIKYLVENECHIWDGDVYKKYCNDKNTVGPLTMDQFVNEIKTNNEFCKKWGELGPIYGKQWRNWEKYVEIGKHYSSSTMKIEESDVLRRKPIDQIKELIYLLENDPDSRRMIVNAWNVGELDEMTLPPCHYGFQVYTRELTNDERWSILNTKTMFEKRTVNIGNVDPLELNNIPKRSISLMWNQRSVDSFLGLPFNIASYALLLEILGKIVNMIPEELVGNLGDTHLYLNHIEQAKKQIGREPFELPKLNIDPNNLLDWNSDLDTIIGHIGQFSNVFIIEDYKYHPVIKAPLSN